LSTSITTKFDFLFHMGNFRALLLIAFGLGIASNLPVYAAEKAAETLPSTTPKTKPDFKVQQSRVRLSFCEQKPGTEARLKSLREVQQGLVQKQLELKTSGTRAETRINDAALKHNDAEILSLFEKPVLTEKNLIEAYTDSRELFMFSIDLKFDVQGSKAFAALTKKVAGTGRSIGIFINDRLLSNPMVSQRYSKTGVTGGLAEISGNFTAQQAEDLAAQLRGDPPAPVPK
jgi:preprotein translocase subunit SecD